MTNRASDHTASAEEIAELHALVRERGEPAVCTALGIPRSTFARVIGGLGVRMGSLVLMRAGLARVRREEAA